MKTKNIRVVRKYIELLEQLPELIKNSAIKEQAIYTELGISRKTWHNRKTLKNWSPEEMITVFKMIG
jgi:uncharacterized protein (DUF2384 family)